MLFLLGLVASSLATPKPIDVLIVTDRSASMFNYNRAEFYQDVVNASHTWSQYDFRVGVVSCDPKETLQVSAMGPRDWSLTMFHQKVMKLNSHDENCLNALDTFIKSPGTFRREGVPLSVYVFSDKFPQTLIATHNPNSNQ